MPKGPDTEWLAHVINHPGEEFVRGRKQGKKEEKRDNRVSELDLSADYTEVDEVEVGGVSVQEWYTRDLDASGGGVRAWDRRPDEPMESYQAFVCWLFSGIEKEGDGWKKRTLVPGRRSHVKAYRHFLTVTGQIGDREVRHAPSSWYRLAHQHDWEKRAASYDRLDLEEFGEAMALARRDIIDEMGKALSIAMRACVTKIENSDLSDLSTSAAIYALVQIMQEYRNFFNFQDRSVPQLDAVLDAIPDNVREAVLIAAVNIDQLIVQKQDGDIPQVVDVK